MKRKIKHNGKLYEIQEIRQHHGGICYFVKGDNGKYSYINVTDDVTYVDDEDAVKQTEKNSETSEDVDYQPVDKEITIGEQSYYQKLQKRVMRFWQRCGFQKLKNSYTVSYSGGYVRMNWMEPVPTVYACINDCYKKTEWLQIRGILVDTEDENVITVTIHTTRPGLIIGKAGKDINNLEQNLTKWFGKKVKVDFVEVKRKSTYNHGY